MRYIFALLVFTTSINAQTVQVKLHDGSLLIGKSQTKVLLVQMKYGLLRVPLEDVQAVTFGLHYDPSVKEKILTNLRKLDSASYKERDSATKELADSGKYAYPLLTLSGDPERDSRIFSIRKKILEVDADVEALKDYDVVEVADMALKGKIENSELLFYNGVTDNLKIKLSQIQKVVVSNLTESFFTVPTNDAWLDTGINLTANSRVTITASGSVDLWPPTIGQFVASPKGYPTIGKGGIFLSGSLIAKIGNNAPIFIGEHSKLRAANAGALQLMIVPSPWNQQSTGSYKVTIKGE